MSEPRLSKPRQRTSFPTVLQHLRAVVTDDGSRTLQDTRDGLAWHSESGALAESQHVYLKNSGVNDRLQQGKPTRVLEVGFGTGLCFWLAATAAYRCNARLDYVSFENMLLPAAVASELRHDELSDCQPAYDQFAARIFDSPQFATGRVACHVGTVNLELFTTDISNDVSSELGEFDAVFHDPFSPEDAPEMWSEELFQKLFDQLKPHGRLVTYCVKSSIQRLLVSIGFEVVKTKGPPGGKREVLIATRRG